MFYRSFQILQFRNKYLKLRTIKKKETRKKRKRDENFWAWRIKIKSLMKDETRFFFFFIFKFYSAEPRRRRRWWRKKRRTWYTFGNCDSRETPRATWFLVELGRSLSFIRSVRAAEKRANDFWNLLALERERRPKRLRQSSRKEWNGQRKAWISGLCSACIKHAF